MIEATPICLGCSESACDGVTRKGCDRVIHSVLNHRPNGSRVYIESVELPSEVPGMRCAAVWTRIEKES